MSDDIGNLKFDDPNAVFSNPDAFSVKADKFAIANNHVSGEIEVLIAQDTFRVINGCSWEEGALQRKIVVHGSMVLSRQAASYLYQHLKVALEESRDASDQQ
ncbi:hypothetical protein [Carnimonas bestiolae]|uniref:hypothetical protein n=1 Tax=Carnimonas bestiolae TaxID=3402172 RepID=UPI003EDC9756